MSPGGFVSGATIFSCAAVGRNAPDANMSSVANAAAIQQRTVMTKSPLQTSKGI
jgi:hypothetical protein